MSINLASEHVVMVQQAARMRIDLANERVVSVQQAAKHFSISPAAAWRYVLKGVVPSVKIGRSRRVTIESFARAFQQHDASEIESELTAEGM